MKSFPRNNFNLIAPYYDSLVNFIYGSALKTAQCHFLDRIPEQARVLVLGGGSGWIINEIFKAQPTCSIVYMEASQKMIELSIQSVSHEFYSQVCFINNTDHVLHLNGKYDVVLTPFFLDVFSYEDLNEVIRAIYDAIGKSGLWIQTDFEQSRWWHKYIVYVMYLFFRLTTNLSGNRLLKFRTFIEGIGMNLCEEKHFFHELVISTVYKK